LEAAAPLLPLLPSWRLQHQEQQQEALLLLVLLTLLLLLARQKHLVLARGC
jgi:hypothetical protein